jgi:periplasmic protein TonB
MSDKSIEKTFLYLLAASLLLHGAIFALFILLPEEKKVFQPEPYMVELRDLPEQQKSTPAEEKEVKRLAEKRERVLKEMAPRGERERDKSAPPPSLAVPLQRPDEKRAPPAEREEVPLQEPPRGESVFKPKASEPPDISKLFPSPGKMAKLEESYRKKYAPELEVGETKFLNTDDILFGSFLRRFETAVYGVWRYPQEAARQGIEGVTPVRITFNRKGEIEHIELLESSGSKILDEEVVRTLRQIGRVGSFPRSYTKDTFNLIAFFHYGITRGGIRGTLR